MATVKLPAIDGNNVDIDTENAELAKNQIKYYTMLDSTSVRNLKG